MKQKIIQLHLNGVSERKIASQTKKARNTVRKYIKQFKQSKQEDVQDLPITEEVLRPPTYKKRKGKQKVLTDGIKAKLRSYIQENQWKKDHYMSKQQMKVTDMHEKLLDDGHRISYTTIRNFVNKEISTTKEVFIRRHAVAGYEVEFDWGEIKLEIDQKLKTYNLAIFTLTYNNYMFAIFYESQSMVCVLDVHVDFIDHTGFIPKVFTYDNMRTVVKQFVGTERKITDSMVHLSNYYEFKIRLCQPRKGNEKGHVERSVDFIRRKAFSAVYAFLSLQEASVHLESTLEKLNKRRHHEHKVSHYELLKHEAAQSKPAISSFDPSDMIEVRVNKYSTIVFKQNHYSVTEGHVGKHTKAKVGAKKIKLVVEGELIAVHERCWGLHQWVMDINHYLKTFERKKGAIAQSECLRQAPTKIKNIYYDYYIGKEKKYLELLHYIQENNNIDEVINAIDQLKAIRINHVSTERVLFLCEQSASEKNHTVQDDDVTKQAEDNMMAYAALFDQSEEVTSS